MYSRITDLRAEYLSSLLIAVLISFIFYSMHFHLWRKRIFEMVTFEIIEDPVTTKK